MKNTRFSKLATLVLVCAITICAFAGVLASAEEAVPTAEIETANVAYNDMVQLAFTVESANLPEGAEIGIMVWKDGTAEFTAATASYATYEANEKDGVTYYKTAGIPAPEMDTPIYVAAVYKANGKVTVAETPFKYSALQYAGTRLTETNVSANQAALYEDLINYGMNSDVVLESAENYAFVKVTNGTIGSAGAEIGGWLGKKVLLRAEAKNAAGEYFIKWVDENGEPVSANRLAYVTVTEAGITEYTAIFGDKADSAYASTYDFESIATGKITKNLTGLSFEQNNGNHNQMYITESLNGDKQLLIDRIKSDSNSYSVKFAVPTGKQTTAVEFDFEFTESIEADVLNLFYFYLKDADGTTTKFRLNLNYSKPTNNFRVYMEANSYTYFLDDNGNQPYIDAFKGSTVTFGFKLDLDNIREVKVEKTVGEEKVTYTTYTCDVLLYANGVYLGKVDLMAGNKAGFYKETAETFDENGVPSFLLDKNCTFTDYFTIGSLFATRKDVSIDNVMFYDLVD